MNRFGRLALEPARDENRTVAVALEQRNELVLGDPRQQRRVRDLVAVQVQNRKHRTVGLRIQEPVAVPAGRERARLGLPVADHARNEQVRVVEGSAVRVGERIAELATFVDRAGSLRRSMARNPSRERELPEELAEPVFVIRDVGIQLRIRSFEIGVRDNGRPAVPGPGDVDRAQIAPPNRTVQVYVDQVEPGGGDPKWPSSRGFTCSERNGSRKSGFASR